MDRDMLFQSEGPLRRALGLAERAMGTEHTLVAWVLDYLGWLASLRELNEEAVSYYRRALGIREACLGPDHPDTLLTIEALASALHTAKAHEESERLALQAIAAYDAMGRDDVGLAELIATVGGRQYNIGRIGEAEHLSLRALAMQERLLGSAHRDTADTALCVAMIYDYGGSKSAPANAPEIYYRKSLEGFAQACGDNGADTIRARFRLADYLFRQGRSDEARPMFNCVVSDLTSGHSASTRLRIVGLLLAVANFFDVKAESRRPGSSRGGTLRSAPRVS